MSRRSFNQQLATTLVGAVLLYFITLKYRKIQKQMSLLPHWLIHFFKENPFLCKWLQNLKKKRKIKVTYWINLAKLSDHTHFKPEVLHIHLETVPARHDQSATAFVAQAGSDMWPAACCLTDATNKFDRFVKGANHMSQLNDSFHRANKLEEKKSKKGKREQSIKEKRLLKGKADLHSSVRPDVKVALWWFKHSAALSLS